MAGKRKLGQFKPTITRPPSPPANPPRGPFKSDQGPRRGDGAGKGGHRWRVYSSARSTEVPNWSDVRYRMKYMTGMGLKSWENPPIYWCSRCFLLVGVNGPDEADDSCVESQFRNMLET